MDGTERVDCATPDLSEMVCPAVHFSRGRSCRRSKKAPWLSRASTCTRSMRAQGQRWGGASAASEKFCDKLRRKVGADKTSSFQVVKMRKVEACEGNFRQIATGWVLERSRAFGTLYPLNWPVPCFGVTVGPLQARARSPLFLAY